jgi:hypothetical protein
MLFCKHYSKVLNILMTKWKDPEPDLDPYLWLIAQKHADPADQDPDPHHCLQVLYMQQNVAAIGVRNCIL